MKNIRIGERVQIRHEVDHDKKGRAFLRRATSPYFTHVSENYHDGRVKVTSGDVWSVERHKNGNLITVKS